MTSGWHCMTPMWPLTQYCVPLWSGILLTKFGGYMVFLSKLTSGWPHMTCSMWPLTPDFTVFHSGQGSCLLTKYDSHMAIVSNLTSSWPHMTPVWPLTPALCGKLCVRGFQWPELLYKNILSWFWFSFGSMFSLTSSMTFKFVISHHDSWFLLLMSSAVHGRYLLAPHQKEKI